MSSHFQRLYFDVAEYIFRALHSAYYHPYAKSQNAKQKIFQCINKNIIKVGWVEVHCQFTHNIVKDLCSKVNKVFQKDNINTAINKIVKSFHLVTVNTEGVNVTKLNKESK